MQITVTENELAIIHLALQSMQTTMQKSSAQQEPEILNQVEELTAKIDALV